MQDVPRATPPQFDSQTFRRTLGRFPTGVTIVTACLPDGQPLGMTVSSFNSVSLSPPLVLWSLALKSGARQIFEEIEHYAIHVLASGQAGLARQFAMPGRSNRFEGVSWHPNEYGVPILNSGHAAWFECFNRSRYHEGDHMILVGEVERCGHTSALPLVFHAGGFQLTPGHDDNAPTHDKP